MPRAERRLPHQRLPLLEEVTGKLHVSNLVTLDGYFEAGPWQHKLKLVRTRTFTNGNVMLVYEPLERSR